MLAMDIHTTTHNLLLCRHNIKYHTLYAVQWQNITVPSILGQLNNITSHETKRIHVHINNSPLHPLNIVRV